MKPKTKQQTWRRLSGRLKTITVKVGKVNKSIITKPQPKVVGGMRSENMKQTIADVTIKHAGEISQRMHDEGYQSLWEKIFESSHAGPKINVFWVNLETGSAKLTSTFQWHTDIMNISTEEIIDHSAVKD